MNPSDKVNAESSPQALEKTLLQKAKSFSLDREMRQIAERIRDQAKAELRDHEEICEEQQELVRSLQVVKGQGEGEYLVVSAGNYGRNLEFGTRNSPESPWFTRAFAIVTGSIDNCLQGALKRALPKMRRFSARQ